MFAEATSAHGGLSVVAMLLLAAFAVDRLATAITFVMSRPAEQKEQDRNEWNRKLAYALIASAIAIPLIVYMKELRLLTAMGMVKEASGWKDVVDGAITLLVLVGGGERISSFLGAGGGKSEAPQPVHLTVTASGESSPKAGAATGGH
jgi:hypothetical protein